MFRTLLATSLIASLAVPVRAGEPKEKWPSAQTLLDIGLSQARAEGKGVHLEFGAPWCGCSRMLDRTMNDPEVVRVLSRHLVLVRVRCDKSAGYEELIKRLGSGTISPIWFLDADGVKVPGTDNPFSPNVGFPASPKSRAAYTKALRLACPKMTDDEAALVARKFRENPWSVESVAARGVEDAAGRKLMFAKALLQDGKRDKAREWLERVVRDDPGTTAAQAAARLLKELTP
jgi:FimV-like protein